MSAEKFARGGRVPDSDRLGILLGADTTQAMQQLGKMAERVAEAFAESAAVFNRKLRALGMRRSIVVTMQDGVTRRVYR